MNNVGENSVADKPETLASSTSRRKLLNRLWAILGFAALVEAGWLGTSILGLRKSGRAGTDKDNFITAGVVKDFPLNSVTAVPEGQFYLTRQEDGSFLALSRTCTHLGCSVPWDKDSQKFICPCHGSTFDIGGEVLTPPATRALESYPLRIENGIIRVNISRSDKRLQDGKPRSVHA